MLYKNIELKCTDKELQDFIKAIEINYSIHNFSEKYNNVLIQNPTGVENAKYYVLTMQRNSILQTHVPYVQGLIPLTDENIMQIIDQQKQEIIDNMIFSKFKVTEEDKTNIEKETFAKSLAQLTVEDKKKDAMISQLAQQVNSLNIKINQLGGNK